MQYPYHGEVPSARPKLQYCPPDYLSPRQPALAQDFEAIQYALMAQSSHTGSPLSQCEEYVTLDEWNEAEEQHDVQQHSLQSDARRPVLPEREQRPSSPYHRPWEFSEPSAMQAKHYYTPNEMADLHAQRRYAHGGPSHPNVTSTPGPHRYPASQHYMMPPVNPSRAYTSPVGPTAQPADLREPPWMASLNRMMSELQVIKDQVTPVLPRNLPPSATLHSGEQSYYYPSTPMHPRGDYQYAAASNSQPCAQGYPQQYVSRWNPQRPSQPLHSANIQQAYIPNPQHQYAPYRQAYATPAQQQHQYVPHQPAYATPAQQPLAHLRERTYRGPILIQ